MKRCPECGFRAKDKTCPLCGVRMRDLPGAAKELQTHVHRQSGESCALPNRERQAAPRPAAKPVQRPAAEHSRVSPDGKKQTHSAKQKGPGASLVQVILIIVIFALFRACAG